MGPTMLMFLALSGSAFGNTLSTTSYAGLNNGSGGAMFAVAASTDINISAVDVYGSSSYSSCNYLAYVSSSALASPSSLSSITNSSGSWTQIASGTTGALSTTVPATISFSTPISMAGGTYRGIYVTFTSCTMKYLTGATGSVVNSTVIASDTSLSVYIGYGRSYSSTWSSGLNQPRAFYGSLTYSLACANPSTYYRDADGDGYGLSSASTSSCSLPSGYSTDSTDCNDSIASVNPGATEVCDTSNTDEDCNGSADDSDSGATGQTTWYLDGDSDGYGGTTTQTLCDRPSASYITTGNDCDDSNAAISPGDLEVCDANNVDEDCDGLADDADSSATGKNSYYLDNDADTFGDPATATSLCDTVAGYVVDNTDCNDSAAGTNPGASEICDPFDADENCDEVADDNDSTASGQSDWYQDSDGDNYGDSANSLARCDAPVGYVASSSDCDDSSSGINPGATEICDSSDTDENCNGLSDDGDSTLDLSSTTAYYMDGDSDSYGDQEWNLCEQPIGSSLTGGDCDDADATEYPGADEICDTDDDNCDGQIDEATAIDAQLWYGDFDGDGYGDAGSIQVACYLPTSFVADSTDCDDGIAQNNPGAVEVCDGLDNNCDGAVDESSAADAMLYYVDTDGDGFGSGGGTPSCSAISGSSTADGDCDETSISIYPGAYDIPYDGTDQDCNGSDACDEDGDSYDATACGGDDCDDADINVNIGATEVWYDGVDQDCSGGSDYDVDGDSHDDQSYGGDDCDDANADIYPGAPDIPYDGVSTDCDDTNEFDADEDGFNSDQWNGSDCNDNDPDVNPDVTEVWYDGTDGDCSGGSDYDMDGDGQDSSTYGGSDCDDANPDVYLGAQDDPYDGVISDCDEAGEYDADGDGAKTPAGGGGDCDDANSAVYPGATEGVDDGLDSDCDSGELCYVDADDDGQRERSGLTVSSTDLDCQDTGEGSSSEADTDCDDAVATTFDGAPELCDGVDNSCDGVVDEDCALDSGDSGGDSEDSGSKDDPSCGCVSGGASPVGLLLLAGLGLRRRRR